MRGGIEKIVVFFIFETLDMVAKFTYSDAVKVKLSSDPVLKPGQLASIVGAYDKEELKKGGKWEGGNWFFDRFKPGVVYIIEYEDGSAENVHEDDLEPCLGT
ncbi:hypothetical protein AGMMS49960_05620 [Betaproteobacteria bacterium]|nr:hypothetical protein AGMMS49960_05620 [Betaproteobacteria bacterium]